MTDFAKTMKNWRKMCKVCFRRFGRCCSGCPLDNLVEGNCRSIYEEDFADVVDWEELEKRIDAWAAEHPEPKYPTWYEYLSNRYRAAFGDIAVIARQPIPADIAEKLGIGPKEG